MTKCPHCEGTGICFYCKGKGKCTACEGKKGVNCPSCGNSNICHFCGILGMKPESCPYCKGSGEWDGSEAGIKHSDKIFKITSK